MTARCAVGPLRHGRDRLSIGVPWESEIIWGLEVSGPRVVHGGISVLDLVIRVGGVPIDESTATLVAAGIAAVAAIFTLLATLLGDRRAEMRAAHRLALQAYLEPLGEGIHRTAASATILRRRFVEGSDPTPWRDAGRTGADALKDVRSKVKYTLYGLDEPLRTLSRMPEWVATYKDVPKTNADELLEAMQTLAGSVDAAIRRSYRRGLPPGWIRRWRLKRLTAKVRRLWGERFDTADPKPSTD